MTRTIDDISTGRWHLVHYIEVCVQIYISGQKNMTIIRTGHAILVT